jgi:hypothetical protein
MSEREYAMNTTGMSDAEIRAAQERFESIEDYFERMKPLLHAAWREWQEADRIARDLAVLQARVGLLEASQWPYFEELRLRVRAHMIAANGISLSHAYARALIERGASEATRRAR